MQLTARRAAATTAATVAPAPRVLAWRLAPRAAYVCIRTPAPLRFRSNFWGKKKEWNWTFQK
jgi:hypothetical protein